MQSREHSARTGSSHLTIHGPSFDPKNPYGCSGGESHVRHGKITDNPRNESMVCPGSRHQPYVVVLAWRSVPTLSLDEGSGSRPSPRVRLIGLKAMGLADFGTGVEPISHIPAVAAQQTEGLIS